MPHRRILAIALAAFALAALAPLPPSGASLADRAADALGIAREANRKAEVARNMAQRALESDPVPGPTGATGAPGTAGTNGSAGMPGSDGADGQNGSDGLDGAGGAQGPQGIQGATGAAGAPGADGTIALASAQNATDSLVGTLANITADTRIVSVDVNMAGPALIYAEGQATETSGIAGTPLACWIAADGVALDRREFSIASGEKKLVGVSATATLPAGTVTVELRCQRLSGATDAVVKFLAQDVRISVVGAG